MKALTFGILLSIPVAAGWFFRGSAPSMSAPASNHSLAAHPDAVVRVPVEVITTGSAPQWVYIQVGDRVVPGPGVFSETP